MQDLSGFAGGTNGVPGFDRDGRLIYRRPSTQKGVVVFEDGRPRIAKRTPEQLRDSTALVRFDLDSRKLDTLAFLAFEMAGAREHAKGCTLYLLPVLNPFAVVDDWAVLSDGTVAVVRGRDYRADWVSPDKATRSTGRMQYNWLRLDDSTKRAVLDSTEKAFGRLRAGSTDLVNGLPQTLQAQERSATVMWEPGKACVTGAPRALPKLQDDVIPIPFMAVEDLPDYPPPFALGSTVADREGRVWVRLNQTVGGGSLYDVIDQKLGQVERVLLPTGRVIVGFGSGNRVFMAFRDGSGVQLEVASSR